MVFEVLFRRRTHMTVPRSFSLHHSLLSFSFSPRPCVVATISLCFTVFSTILSLSISLFFSSLLCTPHFDTLVEISVCVLFRDLCALAFSLGLHPSPPSLLLLRSLFLYLLLLSIATTAASVRRPAFLLLESANKQRAKRIATF